VRAERLVHPRLPLGSRPLPLLARVPSTDRLPRCLASALSRMPGGRYRLRALGVRGRTLRGHLLPLKTALKMQRLGTQGGKGAGVLESGSRRLGLLLRSVYEKPISGFERRGEGAPSAPCVVEHPRQRLVELLDVTLTWRPPLLVRIPGQKPTRLVGCDLGRREQMRAVPTARGAQRAIGRTSAERPAEGRADDANVYVAVGVR
jgi:hypothetical protein